MQKIKIKINIAKNLIKQIKIKKNSNRTTEEIHWNFKKNRSLTYCNKTEQHTVLLVTKTQIKCNLFFNFFAVSCSRFFFFLLFFFFFFFEFFIVPATNK